MAGSNLGRVYGNPERPDSTNYATRAGATTDTATADEVRRLIMADRDRDDKLDVKPGISGPHPDQVPTPVRKPVPKPIPLAAGPNALTAQPEEGRPTVETSLGTLDRDTVMNNRVGGTGVVHVHSDPQDTAPAASGEGVVAGAFGGGEKERESGRTERK